VLRFFDAEAFLSYARRSLDDVNGRRSDKLTETPQDTIFHPASQLEVGVDQILRGQGADPDLIRNRSPQLVRLAQRAIEIGRPLIAPIAAYRRLATLELLHERVRLMDGHALQGALVGQHLKAAEAVTAVVCTIGGKLEETISAALEDDPPLGLALDGFGTAAVEALAQEICGYLEREAAKRGRQVSIPLSPGMIGWPVDRGQAQIFDIVNAAAIHVTLTAACVMSPRKSISFVLGEGAGLRSSGISCDYCSMHETCRYQDHYEQQSIET
jgi:hypothetical protein